MAHAHYYHRNDPLYRRNRDNYMPLLHYARQIRGELQNPALTDQDVHDLLEELCFAHDNCRSRRVEAQLRHEILALETAIAA